MADNVIHGEGKPRFVIGTTKIWDGTCTSATPTTITLPTAAGDLDSLNSVYGLPNFQVHSLSSSETTLAKVVSFVDATGIITVDEWTNGTPDNSVVTYLQFKIVDLPYCQRLTEIWTPDFIVKKMLGGDIRRNKRGFYYSASLDYSRYFHKDEMEIVRDLFNKNYSSIIFFPRVDNVANYYEIDIDPESEISFYQLRNHLGHGGIIINIIGTQRLEKIQFADPTTTAAGAVMDADGLFITDDDGIFVTEDQ